MNTTKAGPKKPTKSSLPSTFPKENFQEDIFASRQAKDKALEALPFHTLLQSHPNGVYQALPLALTPASVPLKVQSQLQELGPLFNRLLYSLRENFSLVKDLLGPVAKSDSYTAMLLEMAEEAGENQPLFLSLNRSDYFLSQIGEEKKALQVELNTIAASYPALSGCIQNYHNELLEKGLLGKAPLLDLPLLKILEAVELSLQHYSKAGAVFLMVVQAEESNTLDQGIILRELQKRGIEIERATLEELGEQAFLREAHLWYAGKPVGVVYFRAGYTPEEYQSSMARLGRKLVASSSALSVPDLPSQLIGCKAIQVALAKQGVLEQVCKPEEAKKLRQVFSGLYHPEDPLPDGARAWEKALEMPEEFVLKPQREGGKNVSSGKALVDILSKLSPKEREAYILMQRIHPVEQPTWLVREGRFVYTPCHNEVGIFGAFLGEKGREIFNKAAGYLVRTKPVHTFESGISSGYANINSLSIEEGI